jgi:hypothetical protein
LARLRSDPNSFGQVRSLAATGKDTVGWMAAVSTRPQQREHRAGNWHVAAPCAAGKANRQRSGLHIHVGPSQGADLTHFHSGGPQGQTWKLEFALAASDNTLIIAFRIIRHRILFSSF